MTATVDQPQLNIAFVGAGMSGLACARLLVERGSQVRLFDKARRPGGRMSTRRGEGGLTFDHGAQYFTARTPAFEACTQRWAESGIVAPWKGRVAVLGASQPEPGPTARWVGVPTMSAIPREMAAGLEIDTGVRVGAIERSGDLWSLTDEDGAALGEFDVAVVAVPAGQAVDLLRSSPTLAAQASRVKMAPCWAVMVGFEEVLPVDFDAAFVHDSPLGWVCAQQSKPGRPTAEAWVLHATPEWTQSNWSLEPETVVEQLVAAFARAAEFREPSVTLGTAHRWRYSLPTTLDPSSYLFDDELGLGACGDWCGGPRVEGAYLSGRALAERILSARPVRTA